MNIPNKRFLTFLFIGIFNTLLDIGIFTLLIYIFGKTPQNIIILNIVSFSIVVICAFFLNGKFTFKNKNLTTQKFFKYYATTIFGMVLNTIIVFVLMTILNFGTVISKIIAASIIVFYNYIISKNYVFRE